MPRRSNLDRPPAGYVNGAFLDGNVEGPTAAIYAQALARNLRQAMGGRSLRDLARETGIAHTTIAAVLNGTRWADMVTIARLEETLEVRLWPDIAG